MKMPNNFTYTLSIVLTVGLLACAGDVTLTWTSPTFEKLSSNDTSINPLGRPITASEQSWVGSLVNIGAMVGPLPFGYLAEKVGRKPAILTLATPLLATYLMFAFATNICWFYIGRLLAGVVLGGAYTLLPMYVAEIAQDSSRGKLTVALNCFWTLGNLLPYVLGAYMSIMWFNVIMATMPIVFVLIFFLIAQETPYFLIGANRQEAAEISLKKFRNNTNTKTLHLEIASIQKIVENDQVSGCNFGELFKLKTSRKALGICLFLIIAQEMTGISVVLFYTAEIFDSAGIEGITSDEASIIIGLVLFVSSLFPPFLVERFGRKLLIMVSALGIALAHTLFGIYFFLSDDTSLNVTNLWWLPIVSLILFIIMYNIGLGSIPWTLTFELFPGNVKSTAASLVSVTCWTCSFIITEFYEDMLKGLGECGTFWLFGTFCLTTVVFAFFYVPETRGKSFSEIQQALG